MKTSKQLNQLRAGSFIPQAPQLKPIPPKPNERSLSRFRLDDQVKKTDGGDADYSENDTHPSSNRNKFFRRRQTDRPNTNLTFKNT